MKIALIGDVHANLPALEAVLSDVHERGIQAIWNVGDFLGYGAFPDEVVKRLQQEGAISIAGNYDIKVLKVKKKGNRKDSRPPEKWFAFNWAYENLSKSSREYLNSLPEEMRFESEGKRILLIHGSTASNEEHLGLDTPEERLKELAETANADIIICGHSHQPFTRKVQGVWFINTGSVGRPDDGDPRACYAIMQIKPSFFQLRHYRIEYDIQKEVAAIHERGLPEAFAQMILQGRGLDAVLKTMPVEAMEEKTKFTADDNILKAALNLAESCNYDTGHTHQVTRLALRLYDELQPLHNLGAEERFWLHLGALLHDIGWINGQKGHHKTALRTILDAKMLLISNRDRLIVGSIARYHRKALPSKKHSHYAALKASERYVVRILAAILRVADGLDRTHQSLVQDFSCEITPDQILIRGSVSRPAEVDRQVALKKGKLLEKVFKRGLSIEMEASKSQE